MAAKRTYLIDANIVISAIDLTDSNHKLAKQVLSQTLLKSKFITTSLILQECYTISSFRLKSVQVATEKTNSFIIISGLDTHYLTKSDFTATLKIFSSQTNPVLSFPDCSLIHLAQKKSCNYLLTLDKQLAKFANQHHIHTIDPD